MNFISLLAKFLKVKYILKKIEINVFSPFGWSKINFGHNINAKLMKFGTMGI